MSLQACNGTALPLPYLATAVTMLKMTGVLFEVTNRNKDSRTGHVCMSMKQHARILIYTLQLLESKRKRKLSKLRLSVNP